MQAGAGVVWHARPGDPVTEGQPLMTLLTDEPERFERALASLEGGYDVAPTTRRTPRPTWCWTASADGASPTLANSSLLYLPGPAACLASRRSRWGGGPCHGHPGGGRRRGRPRRRAGRAGRCCWSRCAGRRRRDLGLLWAPPRTMRPSPGRRCAEYRSVDVAARARPCPGSFDAAVDRSGPRARRINLTFRSGGEVALGVASGGLPRPTCGSPTPGSGWPRPTSGRRPRCDGRAQRRPLTRPAGGGTGRPALPQLGTGGGVRARCDAGPVHDHGRVPGGGGPPVGGRRGGAQPGGGAPDDRAVRAEVQRAARARAGRGGDRGHDRPRVDAAGGRHRAAAGRGQRTTRPISAT